jgi:hypothetical protein
MTINTHMPRQGIRPHTWKVQGEIPHKQYTAWLRAKAQARYRGEQWDLTFDEFQTLWHGYWSRRGRGTLSYVMSRHDPDGAWDTTNAACMQRIEYLKRQQEYKRRN